MQLGCISWALLVVSEKYFKPLTLADNSTEAEERARRVALILNVPLKVEPLLSLGCLQCLSSFLALFTIVPLQSVLAPLEWQRRLSQKRLALFLLATVTAVYFIDMGWLYHVIRGQSIVKLYFFYNAIDLADRLLASVGQDLVEHGFSEVKRTCPLSTPSTRYLLAYLYVVMHAFLMLCQVTALNVAFNSHNKALFAVWLSNNFGEVKQAVFKKFERNGLLRICLNDIRERTQYLLCLVCISVRNMEQYSWKIRPFFRQICPYVIALFAAELFVDYLKHIAVVRFNGLNVDLYERYVEELVDDKPTLSVDSIDKCCRNTGFSLLPTAVVLTRTILSTVSFNGLHTCVNALLLYMVTLLCTLSAEAAVAIWSFHLRLRLKAEVKIEKQEPLD